MLLMASADFKDFLFNRFLEWEKNQPGQRSSFSAFSRWLSDNSFNVVIQQQLLSYWIKGSYQPSDEKYLFVLAEKLGLEVYDALGKSRPNPYLYRIRQVFDNIPPDKQQSLAEQAEKFEIENERNKMGHAPKRKKAHSN